MWVTDANLIIQFDEKTCFGERVNFPSEVETDLNMLRSVFVVINTVRKWKCIR